MANPFFEHPILNSPYALPQRHWELDSQGQPTQQIVELRRRAEFITPIPKPKKRKAKPSAQQSLVFDEGLGLSTKEQQYDPTSIINEVRSHVDQWRTWPNPSEWQVTPETARLLQHWRQHEFAGIRPFFCQVEAIETAIWLTEVAPHTKAGKSVLEQIVGANRDANPELSRLALKLATGAGKTTVMAMLIAWQTINAVRRPNSKSFTRGFLVVTPGLTIKDRLRVLQPNDPDSYYASRELVPSDMLDDVNRAKIVITNFHAFKLRERLDLSKGGRQLLQGRLGEELNTLETEGQMLQRVMPEPRRTATRPSRTQIPSLNDLEQLKRRTGLLDRALISAQLAGWKTSSEIGKRNQLLMAAQESTVAVQATAEQIEQINPAEVNDARYPDNALAERLRLIAQLIRAGFRTPIYYTELTGFDTHSRQLNEHANLLEQLGNALRAFIDDMTKSTASRPVLVLVFSEFGRRVAENASQGTDHGTAAPMFLIGSQVKSGIYGPYPELSNLVDGDPIFGIDFRRVYATILQDWLNLSSKQVLGQDFNTLDLIRTV